jgi:hypothetical protein
MATPSQFAPSPGVVGDLAPETSSALSAEEVRIVQGRRRQTPRQSPIDSHRNSSKLPQRICSAIIVAPPIRATRRKRGKSLSRRRGQNPKLRIGTRSDGSHCFYFQYWLDLPGVDDRSRRREFLGPVRTKSRDGLTRTEAEWKKMKFLADVNNRHFDLPSSKTFADAVKHYREVFAPRMLRDSTFSVANTHLKVHLEPDWNHAPVDHINIEAVNEWAWKKKARRVIVGND